MTLESLDLLSLIDFGTSSTCQTLMCLVPMLGRSETGKPHEQLTYVTSVPPTQAICLMVVVHLLLACRVATPFLELTFQMYKNPSFTSPKVARNFELGLKATCRIPKVCSEMMVRGLSVWAVLLVENNSTRGLCPV